MKNDIIKCVGVNENRLPYQQFQQLFIKECELIGQVVQVVVMPQYAAGIVLKQRN